MKKISLLLVLLFTTLFQIGAEEIELTIDVDVPGTLENKIFDMNQRPLHVTKLTLTGTLDETDFKVMRETMISLHTVDISEITNVEGVNFSNHKCLRRIYLPKKLEVLPNNAFSSCSALEDINIPLTVSSIGSSAFSGCSTLDSIVIPNGVVELAGNLFSGCSALKFVDIPKNVIYIGNSVFQGCSSLEEISIPNVITEINSGLFYGCLALKSIAIPRKCEIIHENAFAYCSNLETIVIQSKVKSIRNDVFVGCDNLDTITCLAVIPPQASELGVDELECVLKVPTIVYDDYIRHSYWGKFYTIETIDVDYKYISVSSNDSTMGVVKGSGYYMIGEEIEIKAISKIGRFVKWDDDCTDNPRVIEIKDSMDVDYQAIFARDTLIEDRMCFNYFDLDREGVTCLVGDATNLEFSLTGLGKYGAGPIDYGESDMRSRHTVNWKQGEYDSRTGNRLRTIPEGSFASVRLGNWEIGGEAEGIEYDYLVDTMSADILLVKYAVVLESPGHGPMADPYFRIEILDEAGNVIDSQCGGDMVLTPTDNEWFWNLYSSKESKSYVWRDWTCIGLDLSRYHGQMVKIRFTTRDCTLDTHAGYAYFTLDCMDSNIKVEGCGEMAEYRFEAPDGFRYTWTRGEDRGKVISTEKILSVPANDTAIYYCQVDYLDTEGCGFELSASVEPRFPHADFEWEWIPENCEENKIALINKSCVYTRIGGKDVATDEPCEGIEWIVGDSIFRGEDIDYIFPKEGGSFLVTLRAYVSEGMCWDDTTVVINIPRLGEYRDTIYTAICFGESYLVNNKLFAASGIYADTLVSVAGCDSIIVLDLTVLPTVDVDTMITINEGEQLEFAGEIYTEAGIYHIDRFLDTVCQNITLYLIVETALEDVNVTDLVIVPNPIGVDDNAVVEYDWSVEEQEGLRVEIINSLGQRVDVFEPKSYPIVLPRVGGAGIYYVRITTGVGSVYVGKLMVEK